MEALAFYFKKTGFFLLFITLLSSCIPNKKVVYLQDKSTKIHFDSLIANSYSEYVLREGDYLDVDIKSNDPSINEVFGTKQVNNSTVQLANYGGDLNYLTGFPLNENGDLELPMIGRVHLAGSTLEEAHAILQTEIQKYIKEPYVKVRLGGIRFSVLGECNNPGRHTAVQNSLTIFEALAGARSRNRARG